MDITEKNGQPSMEEILASIRRIIAEEPSGPPPGIDIAPKVLAFQHEAPFDEPSDFDLPSIFRTPAPAPEKPALFGRLTDAIRGATSSTPEPKAPRMGEELLAADHSDPASGPGRNGHPPAQYPALSTLRTARHDQQPTDARPLDTSPPGEPPKAPAPAAQPPGTPPAASPFAGWRFGRTAAPPQAIDEEIKRVMTPFKDTRFQQMAPAEDSPAAENPVPPAPFTPAPAPQPLAAQPPEQPRVDFSSIIPSRMDLPGIPVVEEYRWPPAGPYQSETSFGAPPRPDPSALPPEPPHYYVTDTIAPMPNSPLAPGYFDPASAGRLPGSHDEQVVPFRTQSASGQAPPTGTIEDTTAELLRPMLRQWLADNMPRMVEKALHIEVAESVRTGRKLPGQ
jgi:cell pole-organizing protein PopZ